MLCLIVAGDFFQAVILCDAASRRRGRTTKKGMTGSGTDRIDSNEDDDHRAFATTRTWPSIRVRVGVGVRG